MIEDTVELNAATPDLDPGTEVAGYVIDAKIGQGGMGKVYGAHHPRIGKRVAIKVLERAYCNDSSSVARFEQEARLVNEIRHPNIVDVFQFGELPDKRSFFIMECLTGETLTTRIERAPLSTHDTIEILDAICDALEAAHEHGVVHRDLKSDNVFLATTRGKREVKLLDFGIAKLAGRTELGAVGKTATGVVVGTPAYMSPEQARGQAVEPRTDVYQLGVLAYKMLTRSLPFNAENTLDLIVEQLKTPPPSPKKLAPGTPDALARLVVRMMAKSIDERPSVAEIRAVFAQLVDARPTAPVAAPRRATSILLGLALFLAGAVAFGVFWLLQRNEKTAGAEVAQPTPPPPAPAPTPSAAPPPAPPPVAVVEPAPVPPPTAAPTPPPDDPDVEIEMEPPPAAEKSSSHKHRRSHASDDDDDEDVGDVADEDEAIPADTPGAILFRLAMESAIEIDGKTVAHSSKGGRYEVPPGDHEIRVKAPGRETVTRSVEVPPGGVAIISIADDMGATP